MIFFIEILFFLLIIDYICILTSKKFLDIVKKSNSTNTKSLKW